MNPKSKPGLIAVALLSLATLLPIAAGAQSDTDYKAWMKQASDANGKLRKELKSKSVEAADDANKIAMIFAQIGQFWQQRNADDGTKFAADAATSYTKIAALATAGSFDDASAELKSTEATCSACHKAHRSMTIHGPEIK